MRPLRLMIVAAVILAACGSGDGGDAEVATTQPPTTVADASETTTTTAPTTETTTEPSTNSTAGSASSDQAVSYASLSPTQQAIVDRVCIRAQDPDPADGSILDILTWLQVMAGEAGVPALTDTWSALPSYQPINFGDPGFEETDNEILAAAAPICDEIGWTPAG